MNPNTPPSAAPKSQLKHWAVKIASLLVTGFIFGCVYNWAEPRMYKENTQAGFGYGIAHGAMMPVALPILLAGKDVAIYAVNNTGRGYKLGYICGINLCGLVFFGLAFKKQGKTMDRTDPS